MEFHQALALVFSRISKSNIRTTEHTTFFSLSLLQQIAPQAPTFQSHHNNGQVSPSSLLPLSLHTSELTCSFSHPPSYLASIFGTEQDKVNCSFYYKIGACRHGDRCSRKHVKPSYSQTILLPNLYQNPAYDPKNKMNPSQLQNHFDAFYEDFWCEMCKYGEPEEVVVCDNNNDRAFDCPFPIYIYLSLPSSPPLKNVVQNECVTKERRLKKKKKKG